MEEKADSLSTTVSFDNKLMLAILICLIKKSVSWLSQGIQIKSKIFKADSECKFQRLQLSSIVIIMFAFQKLLIIDFCVKSKNHENGNHLGF